MIQQAKTTPLPWAFDKDDNSIYFDDGDVCPVIAWINDNTDDRQNAADGELIVRAVNCHDELLAACKGLVRYVEAVTYSAGMGKDQLRRFKEAKAAIARATGG